MSGRTKHIAQRQANATHTHHTPHTTHNTLHTTLPAPPHHAWCSSQQTQPAREQGEHDVTTSATRRGKLPRCPPTLLGKSPAALSPCHLSHCHTITLQHHHVMPAQRPRRTATLSHCQTTTSSSRAWSEALPHCHTVTLSHCHTVTLSLSYIITPCLVRGLAALSHCHTTMSCLVRDLTTLSYCHTATSSCHAQ